MKGLYIRWTVLTAIFGLIVGLAVSRYFRDVHAVSPKVLLERASTTDVRLMGMIDAGSFIRADGDKPFRFNLSGEREKVAVVFTGKDTDSLRELKTIVAVGRWDSETRVLNATEIALVPNYGFITSAYLFSLAPLAFFLFFMERRVAMLYVMIRQEKVYQAET